MSDHDTPPPMEPSSTPGNDALQPMPPSSASFANKGKVYRYPLALRLIK
jgi:hypothetical protein